MGGLKWKSTEGCVDFVGEIVSRVVDLQLTLHLDNERGGWHWELDGYDKGDDGDCLWELKSKDKHDWEDEAANAGYRHAYKYYRKEAPND